jgi:hypothetical protein
MKLNMRMGNCVFLLVPCTVYVGGSVIFYVQTDKKNVHQGQATAVTGSYASREMSCVKQSKYAYRSAW